VYIIVVYDIKVERVNRVHKLLKQYLNWIQNSVFEGEIDKANMVHLEKSIRSTINGKEDSVIVYEVVTKKLLNKKIIGLEKEEITRII